MIQLPKKYPGSRDDRLSMLSPVGRRAYHVSPTEMFKLGDTQAAMATAAAELGIDPDSLGWEGSRRARIRRIKTKIARIEADEFELRTAARDAEARDAAERLMSEWYAGGLRLESPQVSTMDRFLSSLVAGGKADPDLAGSPAERVLETQSLLVQHDWLRLVRPSPEFAAGEWRLPYDTCCFEFKISGARVNCLIFNVPGGRMFMAVAARLPKDVRRRAKIEIGWIFNQDLVEVTTSGWHWRTDAVDAYDDPARILVDMLYSQIKACSIVLDAEVAVTTPLRKPHHANAPRRTLPPLPETAYHVVSLSRRMSRAEPLPADPGAEPRRSPRMHFVRGHWRHYPAHKTWIKWMLRGDPDLGFIDKEYRL